MIWDGTQATAKTSFREKALLFYLKKPFPDVVKVSQWQAVGVELDLYIPSLRIAIEYDGYQWHHNKLALDERKGEICRRFGIRLIRIREPGLPQASRCERVIVLDDSGEAAFAEAICTLFRWLNLPDPAGYRPGPPSHSGNLPGCYGQGLGSELSGGLSLSP